MFEGEKGGKKDTHLYWIAWYFDFFMFYGCYYIVLFIEVLRRGYTGFRRLLL